MANKRLEMHQINEMKEMVAKGVYPEDIANHFGIAVSSVHNYKKRFKDEGLKFPSVKGKRPSNSLKPEDVLPKEKQVPNSSHNSIIGVVNGNESYKFIVNGISIEIGEGAKSINIGKDHMEIKF